MKSRHTSHLLNWFSTNLKLSVTVLLGGLLLGAGWLDFAPPSNDECDMAEVIDISNGMATGSGTTISGTTIDATTAGAPPDCGLDIDQTDAGGVWYTFTGMENVLYKITGSGTTIFDTEISVFTGSCGDLSCVVGNDDEDICGTGTGTVSAVFVYPPSNTQYYIYVKGKNGDAGDFFLNIRESEDCEAVAACDATAGGPVCPSGSTALSVKTNSPGMWTVVTGLGTISNPTSSNNAVYNAANDDVGTIEVIWTTVDPDGNGPCEPATASTTLEILDPLISAPPIGPIPSPAGYENAGYWGYPIVYADKLYMRYEDNDGKFLLMSYDGTALIPIPNPGYSYIYDDTPAPPIIYNGKLYLQYVGDDGNVDLFSYDGTTLTLIESPAGYDADGKGYEGFPFIFDGKLYLQYNGNDFNRDLFSYDDDGAILTPIESPPGFNGPSRGYSGSPIIYDGKLYLRYVNGNFNGRLFSYDGTTLTPIESPPGYSDFNKGYQGNPIVYAGKLYLRYQRNAGNYDLISYDGTIFEIIENPPGQDQPFDGYTSDPIIYAGKLYLRYTTNLQKAELYAYDGTTLELIETPAGYEGNFNGYSGSSFIYNGKLYLPYFKGRTGLFSYDGTTLTPIDSPPGFEVSGGGYRGSPIIYDDILYLEYLHGTERVFYLVSYDGMTLTPIENAAGYDGPGSGYYGRPIIYDGKLYLQYQGDDDNADLAVLNNKGSLISETVVVCEGGMFQLNVTGSSGSGTWSSSNPSVATVNANGQIMATPGGAGGSTTIRFTEETGCFDEIMVMIQKSGKVAIAGLIATAQGNAVEGVNVSLVGQLSNTSTTGESGDYVFENLISGDDYTIIPSKDGNAMNGVSTFDMVLISQHILGVEALDSPYKLLAADVNNSQSITTLDLIQIRRLILSIDAEFPNKSSWTFVRKDYVFPDPENPWFEQIPLMINLINLEEDYLTGDFVAIKSGDVDGSAIVNSRMAAPRNVAGTFSIHTQDVAMKAGNEYTLSFTAEELAQIRGYQFTLNFDHSVLELVDLHYGVAKEDNFGLTHLGEGVITTSWNEYGGGSQRLPQTAELFSMVVRVKFDAMLSELMSIGSRYTVAEAYGANNEQLDVSLSFGDDAVANAGFELYQNIPNPFVGETQIGFTLPNASDVTITINDVTGKTLKVIRGDFAKGYNTVNVTGLPGGVMYYTLKSGDFMATRKMIKVD